MPIYTTLRRGVLDTGEKISIQVLVVQYSFLNNIQKCKTKSTKTVITILAKPDAHKSLYRSPDRTYIIGLVLWCLIPLSTTSQLYCGLVVVSVIGAGNWSARRIVDMPQVTDELDHIMLYQVHLA
jgi:hypothetical protein